MTEKSLVKTSVITASSSAVNSILRLLLTLLLAHHLTPEKFGMWASLTSVAAILMIGDFGVGNALRNKISQLIVNEGKNGEMQRQYFYIATYGFLALSAFSIMLILCLHDVLPFDYLFKKESQAVKAEGDKLLFFILIIYLASLPFAIPSALFHSYNESGIASFVNMLNGFLTLAIIYFLITLGYSEIETLVHGYFATQLVVNILVFIYFVRRRGWIYSFKVDMAKAPTMMTPIFKSGLLFMANDLSIGFLLNSPTILVAAAVDLKTAAIYNLSQKLFSFFALITQSTMNPIWSRLSSMKEKGDSRDLMQICQTTALIVTLIFIPLILLASIHADTIFNIISGKEYETNATIVGLVGLSFFAYAIYDIFSLIQKAFGNLQYRLLMQVGASLVVGYLLKISYGYVGMIGIPLAFMFIWLMLAVIMYFNGKKIISEYAH